MTLVVAILLLMFGLDPATGKLKIKDPNKKHDHKHHKHGHRHDHSHGHHPPPARDDKKIKEEEDPVMKYFDSAETGGGGGGGSTVEKDETNKEKANRILSKSLLFYSEEETDRPETKVEKDKKHLDTVKYQLFVDSVSNTLSGMGESEMASDLQTKSNACINSAKKMDKDEAKNQ